MKTILVNMLALVVVIAVGIPLIGGTLATWSDSETMMGNYIKTGSLDILVAQCGENWQNPGTFNDDTPWGIGLEPCFNLPEVKPDETYPSYLLLWNAGCIDGVAYLHIKDVPEENPLALSTVMQIWYDHDADPETSPVLVDVGSLAELNCEEVELGLLEADQCRQLQLVLITGPTPPSGALSFDISFELIQAELIGPRYAWADTEQSPNALNMFLELGGTPGFWSNPGAVNLYGKDQIVGWFTAIVGGSTWFTGVPITGTIEDDYATMKFILKNVGAGGYTGMVNQFRAQYLATRLNTMTDPPRLQLGTLHDIDGIFGAKDYFGYESGTLEDIIAAIESKAEGDMFIEPPSKDEMEILKDVCDYLNNP
jgi:predicted ribosomally synthesized peptide with SipW-like signal peptide